MSSVERKQALVVGLGLTGLSCVRHLAARGFRVRAADTRSAPPGLGEVRREFPQVEVAAGRLPPEWFREAGLIVVSPGLATKALPIPPGARPIGDIELFARTAAAPVLAVTGANGKSTVTALTGEMCRAAGLKTAVGGNIGVPALELLEGPQPDVYVLELSSFQLETTYSLNACAATVLNLTPDHMDRYAGMAEYAAAKQRIFAGDGVMVLNADDPLVLRLARPNRRIVRFGLRAPDGREDHGLMPHRGEEWLARGTEPVMPAREVPLAGRHNLANVLAAMALASAVGVPAAAQVAAAKRFKGLPHRTELVAEKDGVRWINDSKGTNVGATVAALNGMTAPTVLIAGGDGKGQDFGELRGPVARHARAVVLIGRDAPLMETALGGVVPLRHARDLHEAVRLARQLTRPGDAVLLSPACASFDMFRNYEHRGEVFRAAVEEEALA